MDTLTSDKDKLLKSFPNISDGDMPHYLHPEEPGKPAVLVEKKPSSLQQGPGSGLDADTIHSIGVVTASAAATSGAKSVLVATDSTGKLPLSIIPTNPSAYKGPSNQTTPVRAFGTVYQNTQTVPLFVCATGTGGTNGIGIVAVCDSAASPTTQVGRQLANGSGITGSASLTFVALPNYYYKVSTLSASTVVDSWLEWY